MMAKADNRTEVQLKDLEKRIGYMFSDTDHLKKGLTHSSFRNHSNEIFHYERLEFLGDRVLGLCVAELLFERFPNAHEGELSRRLNALVNGTTLAQIADQINLHEFIRAGDDLTNMASKRMRSVRADVMESLIASIYLDGGLTAASEFIKRLWKDRLNDDQAAKPDPKTALQEWAHAKKLQLPDYCEVGRNGPDHEPVFSICLTISGYQEVNGSGRSKRNAEQEAATKFLVREGIWNEETIGVSR